MAMDCAFALVILGQIARPTRRPPHGAGRARGTRDVAHVLGADVRSGRTSRTSPDALIPGSSGNADPPQRHTSRSSGSPHGSGCSRNRRGSAQCLADHLDGAVRDETLVEGIDADTEAEEAEAAARAEGEEYPQPGRALHDAADPGLTRMAPDRLVAEAAAVLGIRGLQRLGSESVASRRRGARAAYDLRVLRPGVHPALSTSDRAWRGAQGCRGRPPPQHRHGCRSARYRGVLGRSSVGTPSDGIFTPGERAEPRPPAGSGASGPRWPRRRESAASGTVARARPSPWPVRPWRGPACLTVAGVGADRGRDR